MITLEQINIEFNLYQSLFDITLINYELGDMQELTEAYCKYLSQTKYIGLLQDDRLKEKIKKDVMDFLNFMESRFHPEN